MMNGKSTTNGNDIQSEHGTIRRNGITNGHRHVDWDTRLVTAVKAIHGP